MTETTEKRMIEKTINDIPVSIEIDADIDKKTLRYALSRIDHVMEYSNHTWKNVNIKITATTMFLHIWDNVAHTSFLTDKTIWKKWYKNNPNYNFDVVD